MPLSLAVIGTAGRKEDSAKLSFSTWTAMVQKIAVLIARLGNVDSLVSGGAAYADHIAVALFLNGTVGKLVLHLPAAYDFNNARFTDTGVVDFRRNPGGTANYYHRKFSPTSLAEIGRALQTPGCTCTVSPGLFERNSLVANADALVALTFGHERKLKDGGTADTFGKYLAIHGNNRFAYHVDLHTMLCWPLAEL